MDDGAVYESVLANRGRANSAVRWARTWPNSSPHSIARRPSVTLHQTS